MHADAPFSVNYIHRLRFTRGVFAVDNPVLADVVRAGAATGGLLPARLVVFIDSVVADAWPELPAEFQAYATAHADVLRAAGDVQVLPGGERAKNDREIIIKICQRIHDAAIDRQSYVLVIGGGAVLDTVGFAAAVVHRGVRLIRVPSTTLAQADSGVGVKNGINAFGGKKNFLGAFAPPWAVINDERLLSSLSDRDWRCGFAEAVKVALVKDGDFFRHIAQHAAAIRQRDEVASLDVIRRSALTHMRHITGGGDPFEMTIARPLDFGHWSAHRLEPMTQFSLRHGEAVAIGVALDSTYSKLTGQLDAAEHEQIIRTLRELGFVLYHPALADTPTLLKGLEEFREHLGGQLTITLLRGLGVPVEVHEMDHEAVTASIRELERIESSRPVSRH